MKQTPSMIYVMVENVFVSLLVQMSLKHRYPELGSKYISSLLAIFILRTCHQFSSGKISCLLAVKCVLVKLKKLDFDIICGMKQYPAYDSFLESVQEEAEQTVKRLRHHPSVVILGKFS